MQGFLISREDAALAGLTHFYTGKPCKRGHIAHRYVSSGACFICADKNMRLWAEKNPDKKKESMRESARRIAGLPLPTRPPPETCECCGKRVTGRHLCLDHCHNTGKFRGWLCDDCNLAIGRLGDTEEGVRKALEYLTR